MNFQNVVMTKGEKIHVFICNRFRVISNMNNEINHNIFWLWKVHVIGISAALHYSNESHQLSCSMEKENAEEGIL